MVKILKDKERKDKEQTYNELDKIDSSLLDINSKLRMLGREFEMKRDVELVKQIRKKILWCANKTLLLKGRITSYELGSKLFMDREYLQFHYRRTKTIPRNLKYIPLRETNYSGKKFKNFMKNELGAKAHVGMDGNKLVVLSILIPRNKKNLIIYN